MPRKRIPIAQSGYKPDGCFQLAIRLDPDLSKKLERAVTGKDITMSQIVRQALREYFSRMEAAA